MRLISGQLRLSATDLGSHLACRHVTFLDLQVVQGKRAAPPLAAPDLLVIQEMGRRHEAAYLKHLADVEGLTVENLAEIKDDRQAVEETLRLMTQGAEVIAQGALANGEWFGRADVLRRVKKSSAQWDWSYEVADTKLARETKGATILQLSLYSELLETIQGCAPEVMWVIPPGNNFRGEAYRVEEYAAYYRYVRGRLLTAVSDKGNNETYYPEPVEHCYVCRWFRDCDARRRADDHLSLVAGIRRQQRDQLAAWDVPTMAKLAVMPIPLKQRPLHGSRNGMERVREQARVQVAGRTEQKLKHEPIVPLGDGIGYCRLPEPSVGDVFLDLEGDPFVGERGLQYMFGFAVRNPEGEPSYEKRWALNLVDEKRGFEWLVDEIVRRSELDPKMHVYHFGSYEPAALKRLMSMHATREDEVDRMLRAGMFVDLHQVFKQGTRASVEEYSLKKIEVIYGFDRKTALVESRAAMRYLEHRLELGWGDEELPQRERLTMEGYNGDDCLSLIVLQEWLEKERRALLDNGMNVPRPPEKSGEPSERLKKKLDRAEALTIRLCEGVPVDPRERSEGLAAQWLLAQLLSWHRREDKSVWQEGYRLADSTDEELLDERVALTCMRFLERLKEAKGQQVPIDRYSFLPERSNVRKEKDLYVGDEKFGEVVEIDRVRGIVDVKKTKKSAELHPPTVYMWDGPLNMESQEGSLCRLADWVVANGIEAPGRYRAGRDLLLRKPPRLRNGEKLTQLASETPVNTASRIVLALDDSIFAIQGPPGSGKTYTGARMICELVKRGKKVGVTALSHKVIRKLLDDVVEAAREMDVTNVRCLHRQPDGEESDGVAVAKEKNEEAWDALISGKVNVVGGVSWLWAPEAAFECVDVLFIDEAGQMSLADVLAVSQAAKKLVLLGDPQQLERPTKGSHPEGAEKSALEHLLNGRKTIAEDMGFLLPESWRLHPDLCKFTSQVFYEGKLSSHAVARPRILEGHPWMKGAGLWFIPVEHAGNQNSSPEEVNIIAAIVGGLLKPEVKWYRSEGNKRNLKAEDILIVAPYNAQMADLLERLPGMRVGTVDKFQGQEAPVVIYSLTTSTSEEAPHGMEFLYSLNRLNVATSRAQTAVIVVGSPRLFEPDCRTPRQMQLANALCRFRELAASVTM
jgi:predicted RecB family nuclease